MRFFSPLIYVNKIFADLLAICYVHYRNLQNLIRSTVPTERPRSYLKKGKPELQKQVLRLFQFQKNLEKTIYISAANGDRSLSETEHCGKSKKKKNN